MKKLRMAATLGALLLASQSAVAGLITISADDYTPGETVLAPGVVIESRFGSSGVTEFRSEVTTTTCTATEQLGCIPGRNNFIPTQTPPTQGAWYNPQAAMRCYSSPIGCQHSDSYGVMALTFQGGTDYVQVEGGWFSDPLWVFALNTQGDVVQDCFITYDACGTVTYRTGGANLSTGILTVTSLAPEFYTILIGGGGGAAVIHSVTYNSKVVPEPSTFGLLAVSLLGFGLLGRRRT